MTNHLTWETLNDLVDGVLAPAASAAAETHARECTECGTRARRAAGDRCRGARLARQRWRRLTSCGATCARRSRRSKVAHLPAGSSSRHSRAGWWVTPGRLAAAAVVLVAATASLTGIVMRSQQSPVVAVIEDAAGNRLGVVAGVGKSVPGERARACANNSRYCTTTCARDPRQGRARTGYDRPRHRRRDVRRCFAIRRMQHCLNCWHPTTDRKSNSCVA